MLRQPRFRSTTAVMKGLESIKSLLTGFGVEALAPRTGKSFATQALASHRGRPLTTRGVEAHGLLTTHRPSTLTPPGLSASATLLARTVATLLARTVVTQRVSAVTTQGARTVTTQKARPVTTRRINKYMELTLADQLPPSHSSPRQLVLFYPWLLARPRHAQKYVDLLTCLGVNVLRVVITPQDLLRPEHGAQVCAREVLQFLKAHPQYARLLVYGCSVGGYSFGESLKMMKDAPLLYNDVWLRFVGHIWDSPVDIPGIPEGIAKSFTERVALQRLLVAGVSWLLKRSYQSTTRHYLAAASVLYAGPVDGPSLYLYSRADPLSEARSNERIMEGWRQNGITVDSKVFEGAPHCSLLTHYPNEYKTALYDYLVKVGFIDAGAAQAALAI